MDAETFERKTGRKPEQDDLDRVNCSHAGDMAHTFCGWCDICDKPRFDCAHAMNEALRGK